MTDQHSEHHITVFSSIRKLLIQNESIEAVVVCGSYATNKYKYYGLPNIKRNSDLDAVIISDNRLIAKIFRKKLYVRMAELGIYASASVRKTYENFQGSDQSVSLYDYDEIEAGIVVTSDSIDVQCTPREYFSIRSNLTVPVSEYVMQVINRHFELENASQTNKNREKRKFTSAILELAKKLNNPSITSPEAAVRLAAEDATNMIFHRRYFSIRRRILWTLRTKRMFGHPVNTLHIYNSYINACINQAQVEPVIHHTLDEWRKGTA